jgi:hypothetical protein
MHKREVKTVDTNKIPWEMLDVPELNAKILRRPALWTTIPVWRS